MGYCWRLENHWGLTSQPEGVNRILKALPSEWLEGGDGLRKLLGRAV